MGFLVFCDTDEQGNITDYIAGKNIIPARQYEYFFYLTEEIEVADYKIVDGQLVLK